MNRNADIGEGGEAVAGEEPWPLCREIIPVSIPPSVRYLTDRKERWRQSLGRANPDAGRQQQ
jgi:hypothetical protein